MTKNSFNLNLKTDKAISFIDSEKTKTGDSKTSFINVVFENLADWPIVLAPCDENSSIIDEIKAVRELLNDDLIKKIPQFATLTRRNRVQMILHLVEKGIEADDQLKLTDMQKVYKFEAPTEHLDQKNSALETSTEDSNAVPTHRSLRII